MDYKSIYQEIVNGDAILFLGAGFSVGNKSINGDFKTGKQLANYLCNQVKIKSTDNLNIACSKYLNTFSEKGVAVEALLNELKKEFTTDFICDTHKWILELPWKRIYTTNYDDLIETVSKTSKINRESINILRDIEPKSVENSIIHINGFIKDFDAKKEYLEFDDLFKITHESFFKDSFLKNNWKSLFVDDLYEAKRVVFLGYSLDYDFSLQNMVVDEAKNKCLFIDFSNNNEDESDKAYRFEALGQYSFEGIANFSNQLKAYEGEVFRQLSYEHKAFEKITPEKYHFSLRGSITANDVFKFFVMGKFQSKFLNSEDKIIINRAKKLENIEKIFEDQLVNCLVIHSKLGNGKSIFKHVLMNKLVQSRPVYELIGTENIFNEIEKVENETESYSEYYIIIDDFGEFMNKINIIYNKVSQRCRIVLFARTPIKDNLCNQLYKRGIVKTENLEELDINKLDDNELEDIYKTFSTYGYWGDLNTIEMKTHLKYYKSDCRREFSNLSYFILKSDNIKEKISEIIASVKKRNIVSDFLLADAIISKIGIKLTVLQILEVMDIDLKLFNRIIKNPELRDVLDVNNNDIKILSPIFSDFLLSDFDNKTILNIATKIYNNSAKVISSDKRYSIRKNLVSRSNIKLITNNSGNIDDLAITFFDGLRDSKVSKENPFYWLQYAISMLNKGKFIEAKMFFDNAYKISKEFFDNPDFSHIDTHYSRYLFEKELQNNTVDKFIFDNIKEAHRLLFIDNNNKGSNLKYCLRQIKHYEEIYNKFILKSENVKWSFEYNQMMEDILTKAIEYFQSSEQEKYDIDYQAKQNVDDMIKHFKEHSKASIVADLEGEIKFFNKRKKKISK